MIQNDGTFYVSNEFKNILTRGNKYEDYVLEIMNQSSMVFPNTYKKVEEQSNKEPDFIDIIDGDLFDAKLVVDENQCKALCGNNDALSFFEEISSQNNDVYDSITSKDDRQLKLETILTKQLTKESTKNKNIIFFFTFPIGACFATSIISNFCQSYLTILFSKIKHLANGRKIFAICPTYDGYYEIREMNDNYSEFIEYHNLDKYFNWNINEYRREE